MTLHEAIEKVLVEAKSSLSTNEIASRLNDEGLYIRRDGSLVTSSQIAVRFNNYKQIFTIDTSGKVAGHYGTHNPPKPIPEAEYPSEDYITGLALSLRDVFSWAETKLK